MTRQVLWEKKAVLKHLKDMAVNILGKLLKADQKDQRTSLRLVLDKRSLLVYY